LPAERRVSGKTIHNQKDLSHDKSWSPLGMLWQYSQNAAQRIIQMLINQQQIGTFASILYKISLAKFPSFYIFAYSLSPISNLE